MWSPDSVASPSTHTAPLLLGIALGGAIGALGRWGLTQWLPEASGIPWATLLANLSGCLAIACLPALALVRRRPVLAAALGPGLLGGFTTLSAYTAESRALIADGRIALAATYVALTVLGCVVAVLLGERLTGRSEDEAVAAGVVEP